VSSPTTLDSLISLGAAVGCVSAAGVGVVGEAVAADAGAAGAGVCVASVGVAGVCAVSSGPFLVTILHKGYLLGTVHI
jgi:hypothetical protein